jgi:protein SCO1/2
MMRTVAPVALACILGISALYAGTDGFQAFTSEQARRLAALRAPQAPPHVVLEDQDGRRFALSDFKGKVVLVDFVYTHCRSLCRVAGAQLGAILRKLESGGLQREVMIVTISFDPLRDTPQALRAHAVRLGADPAHWRLARPVDPAQLESLLQAFGIVAVPDGTGEFQHNGAVHVLARDGRLSAIYDYDRHEEVVLDVRARS